jgi:hypothetical protein
VARSELSAKQRQFELLKQMNDVDQQILEHTHNATQANAQGKLEEIRVATSAMMSELRLYQSYGELESAYGQMLATLGLDPVPDAVRGHDLASLTESIGEEQQRWDAVAQKGVGPLRSNGLGPLKVAAPLAAQTAPQANGVVAQ